MIAKPSSEVSVMYKCYFPPSEVLQKQLKPEADKQHALLGGRAAEVFAVKRKQDSGDVVYGWALSFTETSLFENATDAVGHFYFYSSTPRRLEKLMVATPNDLAP
jgi:hypothetical protein